MSLTETKIFSPSIRTRAARREPIAFAALRAALDYASRLLALRRRRSRLRRNQRLMSQLSDHLLKDIGLTRTDLVRWSMSRSVNKRQQ